MLVDTRFGSLAYEIVVPVEEIFRMAVSGSPVNRAPLGRLAEREVTVSWLVTLSVARQTDNEVKGQKWQSPVLQVGARKWIVSLAGVKRAD